MDKFDANKTDMNPADVSKTDDRPAVRKPLADVRLDMELMNALTESKGTDSDCIGKLMVRHERLVWNTLRQWKIRRCDVDEVAGRVWNKVWRMSCNGTWNAGRARHVRDPFVPLLKKICESQAKDFHRSNGRARRWEEKFVEAARSFGSDWRDVLRGPQRKKPTQPRPDGVPAHLEGAVAALPEPLRRVYELHSQGLKNRQISEEVGCSWGEVSKRLNRARGILGVPTTHRKPAKATAS